MIWIGIIALIVVGVLLGLILGVLYDILDRVDDIFHQMREPFE